MVFQKVVLGYDGSNSSKKALEKAIEISKLFNAQLHIVGVVRPFEFAAIDYIPPEEIEKYEKEEISKEEKYLKEAIELASSKGITATAKVLEGEPAEEIMEYADSIGADLIIVGHRGAGGFKKLLLGSTAGNLIKYANQSVLVVK